MIGYPLRLGQITSLKGMLSVKSSRCFELGAVMIEVEPVKAIVNAFW